jgi:hypothetical protein
LSGGFLKAHAFYLPVWINSLRSGLEQRFADNFTPFGTICAMAVQ